MLVVNDMFIRIEERIYIVLSLPASASTIINNSEYYSGAAFVNGEGQVFPYLEEQDKGNMELFGYFIDEGKIKLRLPPKQLLKQCSIEKAIETDPVKLIKVANSLAEKNPTIMEVPGDPADIPKINDTDDFLTKGIKQAIINKNINIKNQIKKSNISKNDASNMISGLKSDRDMSLLYFMRWVEVLGLDFKLYLRDNGEDLDAPMKKEVISE